MEAGHSAPLTSPNQRLQSARPRLEDGRPRRVVTVTFGSAIALAAVLTWRARGRDGGGPGGVQQQAGQPVAVGGGVPATQPRRASAGTLRLAARAAGEAARAADTAEPAYLLLVVARAQAEVGDADGVAETVALLTNAKGDHAQIGDARVALAATRAAGGDVPGGADGCRRAGRPRGPRRRGACIHRSRPCPGRQARRGRGVVRASARGRRRGRTPVRPAMGAGASRQAAGGGGHAAQGDRRRKGNGR